MALPKISITYSLNPPTELTPPASLSKSKTIRVEVDTKEKEGLGAYYAVLHDAVREAKDQLGDDMTRWKELVGKVEEGKEGTKVRGDDDEGLEGDEELEEA